MVTEVKDILPLIFQQRIRKEPVKYTVCGSQKHDEAMLLTRAKDNLDASILLILGLTISMIERS